MTTQKNQNPNINANNAQSESMMMMMISRARRYTTVARFLPLYYCAVVVLILSTNGSRAWSPPGNRGSGVHHTNSILSRRNACQALIKSALTIIACNTAAFPPMPAHADVTNKIASSTALRSLSRAQRQLPTKLLPPAQSNNYIGIKTCLREPPFDTLRKDMLTLVRGGEDGPMADELLLAYKQLIKSLEAIDATSSLGMRGRSGIDPFQLSSEYENVEKALDFFIGVGSEAAGIPLQEDTRQTQIGSIDSRSGKVEPRVL